MKNLFIFIFLCLSFLTNAAIKGERTLTDQLEKNDQVIHIQEVYKTVDTFKLKIDIFYTNQSFERENNTAIVFFHGGGWAFGLALCTAMIDDYSEKSDNLSISCRPDAILLFSACVNAVEGWCDRLLADRRNKIWSISPAHNIKRGMPPMIEFHGMYDEILKVADDFLRKYNLLD